MKLFTVSVMNSSIDHIQKLNRDMTCGINALHTIQDKIKLEIAESSSFASITCRAVTPEVLANPPEQVFTDAAQAIAGYILDHQEGRIVRDMIVKEYQYRDDEDVEKIHKYCMQLLNESDDELCSGEAKNRRISKIAAEVEAYIREHDTIIIEGFVKFRLQNYWSELREVLEYAIDEFLMDQQYQDFISLLKYFVYIQDAKIPVAHLIHKGENEFVILNEQMKPIETKHMDSFVVEMIDKDINYEDMIVSTLITVSPQQVYIHTREPEKQIIKTIEQIFEHRTEICTYCSNCSPILGDNQKKDKLFP